jgi:uncharacterized lipoprotein YajG
MKDLIFKIRLFPVMAVFLLAACQKNNCPRYWAAPDNAQVASSGKKDAGETVDTEPSAQFSLIRVKRDKNGIVVKQKPKTKSKYKDPRKNYKPQ